MLLGGLAIIVALVSRLRRARAQDETNSLQSIDPANGATLDTSPTAIVLSFNQELSSDDRPIVVLSCGTPSQPQDTGSPEVDADGLIVTIPINTPVPEGACTVSWRLADAAGETIVGDFTTFRVDADPARPPHRRPADGAADAHHHQRLHLDHTPTHRRAAASTDTRTRDPTAAPSGSGGCCRRSGILALFGGLALIAIGWPEGPEYVVTVRYLRAVWMLALVGTVLYLIAYAAKFNDTSFGAAINPSAWLDLKDDGWPGRGALLRLAFVLGSGWVAMRPERIIDPTTAMWAWAIPGGALIAVALSRVDGPGAVARGGDRPRSTCSAPRSGSAVWRSSPVSCSPDRARRTCCTPPAPFSRMSTKAMVAVVAHRRRPDDPARRQPVQQQPRPGAAAQGRRRGGDAGGRARGAPPGRLSGSTAPTR